MSSRRAGASRSNNSRRQALEEIRRLRGTAATARNSDNDDDSDNEEHENDTSSSSRLSRIASYKTKVESIYETVTEQEYKELVSKRRQALPFVEDDDAGMGYFDDGEEQFFESDDDEGGDGGRERRTADDEEEDHSADPNSKKRSAGALSSAYIRRAKKMQRAKLGSGKDQKITNMFFASSSSSTKKPKAISTTATSLASNVRAHVKRDIDLDSLLDDLTANPTDTFSSSYARPPLSSSSLYTNTTPSSMASRGLLTGSSLARKQGYEEEKEPVEEEDQGYEYEDNNNHTAFEHEPEQEQEQEQEEDVEMEERREEAEEEDEGTNKVAKKEPVLTKRELLLQKARQTTLQTTAPTARALAQPLQEQEKDEEQKEPVSSMAVPSNEVAEWWQVGESSSPSNTGATNVSTLEEEEETTGSLEKKDDIVGTDTIQMYWMDAVEVRDRPGKIYLIGKMKVTNKTTGGGSPTYKSCCVVINNLQRYMYLVPRLSESEFESDLDSESESDQSKKNKTLINCSEAEQQQKWLQMHEEIHQYLVPSCITQRRDQDLFKTKLVPRKYAFELAAIPRGTNLYLKVKYAAKYAAPPSDLCTKGGQHFSRICGASTRPLEHFLIKRKLLGPGWVEIHHVRRSTENVSFCSMEFETLDPKNVQLLHNGDAPPPLTVMSLSLKTICNPVTQKHEILALSTITETGLSADGGLNNSQKHCLSHFTAIRPLESTSSFPESYLKAARSDPRFQSGGGSGGQSSGGECLRIEYNERALLNYFLTRVQLEDPDVIVGHNLHKYALALLLSRIDNYKLGGLWSKLTRLRRGRLQPWTVGEGWNEYRMDDLVNGRLLCDTYVSAKELLTSQNNYSLTHLVQTQLQKQRLDVEMNDIPQILHGGPGNFVKFLRHTLDDAMFVLQLMHKLEVLPLSKQLASLCGYLWSRTLEANKRAERIEYLLLHEFSRSKNKFIVPDKLKISANGENKNNKKREASYAGGMVFAPKKGLYDNFVVLLDFNSLYPSIIREYNICFTTVERELQEEEDGKGQKKTPKKKKKSHTPKKTKKNTPVKAQGGGDEEEEEEEEEEFAAPVVEGDAIPALPSSSCDEGLLPGVIKRLLESRKQVKQELKVATTAGNTEKAKRLDIRQKAIKLTANSMYGCLGFRFSRFYAKPLAALITSTGRQTLQRAKEVAEQECGYDVVYGDTDSIMVDSRSDKLEDAKRIGKEIQLACNKHFKLLELEVDYIFKAILLLNKKKYAALVVKESGIGGDVTVEKEVKGLDMVRRDWCVISKVVGNQVLDVILSGQSRDDVVEQIHDHLQQVAARMRAGKEPIEQYVITKSLNKAPEAYPDRAKQYHVQVALALKAQGKPIGIGSHIPYVICLQEEPGSGRKAYHPEEVKRSNGQLTIDVEWYLEAQLHPPVNRLCAHIEGTSSPQLAHCLGLETSKFSHATHGNNGGLLDGNDENDAIPSVLQNDAERFQACTALQVTCNRCKQTNEFPGVYFFLQEEASASGGSYRSGLCCVASDCKADLWGYDQEGIYGQVGDDLLAVLSNRLHLATRQGAKKYYEGWVVCSDVTCNTRTQKQSLRGNGDMCSGVGCRGQVVMEYGDNMLYTQLKYFASLFDIERAKKKIHEQQERVALAPVANTNTNTNGSTNAMVVVPPLPDRHREILNQLHTQVEKAVHRNAYNWVQPSIWRTLFT